MSKRASGIIFLVVTIILVLVTAFCCVQTVKCKTDISAQEMENFYREKEQELVKEARAFLKDEGFENSGVMLTRVIDVDGIRQYTLTVHHGKIDNMCESDRAALLEKLEKIVFVDEGCSFFHEFLINR